MPGALPGGISLNIRSGAAEMRPKPMSELSQHLERETEGDAVHGAIGRETEWLGFTQLDLSDGKLLICDLEFLMIEEELLVELSSGRYEVQAKIMEYPGDRRVSRLRLLPAGVAASLGEPLGETWTDTAQTSVWDVTAMTRAYERRGMSDDALHDLVEKARDEQGRCGVLDLDAAQGAVAPFVDSGFGDGTFPVFALIADGRRVGVEIEFIAANEPYPFGEREGGEESAEEESAGDEVWAAFGDMLAELRAKRTGDKETDREAMKNSFTEFLGGLENQAKAAMEEFRNHVIGVRKRPVPLRIDLLPAEDTAWTRQPAAQERIQALERAGFVPAGCFQVRQISTYVVSGYVHPKENVQALVEQSGGQVNLVLASRLADGREFNVQDCPAKPGLPRPPWDWVERHPELPPDALIAAFFQRRPALATLPLRPEDVPGLIEDGFRQVQNWRAERGGWTLAEIKLQKGLPESAETTEELMMARHDSAEVWLFNWLRLQESLPFAPEEVLERLVIIHDDLTPDLLVNEWWLATMDFRAKEELFTEGSPREAFARVNAERGAKLRRVLQKTTGFPADFYLPADDPQTLPA